jgi:hypothetical protein
VNREGGKAPATFAEIQEIVDLARFTELGGGPDARASTARTDPSRISFIVFVRRGPPEAHLLRL